MGATRWTAVGRVVRAGTCRRALGLLAVSAVLLTTPGCFLVAIILELSFTITGGAQSMAVSSGLTCTPATKESGTFLVNVDGYGDLTVPATLAERSKRSSSAPSRRSHDASAAPAFVFTCALGSLASATTPVSASALTARLPHSSAYAARVCGSRDRAA